MVGYEVISDIDTPNEVYILNSKSNGSKVSLENFNVKAIIVDSDIKHFSLYNVKCEFVYCVDTYTTLTVNGKFENTIDYILCSSIWRSEICEIPNLYKHYEGDGIFHYTKDQTDYFIDYRKGIMYKTRDHVRCGYMDTYDDVFQKITTTELEYLKSILGYVI